MKKDFDRWNEEKKKINACEGRFYHEREVWWCSLGTNVGYEQDGNGKEFRRPVLVLKALSRHTCLIVPLSSSLHRHQMRIPLGIVGGKEAQAIVSQLRVIDTRRFVSRMDILKQNIFMKIQKAIKVML